MLEILLVFTFLIKDNKWPRQLVLPSSESWKWNLYACIIYYWLHWLLHITNLFASNRLIHRLKSFTWLIKLYLHLKTYRKWLVSCTCLSLSCSWTT